MEAGLSTGLGAGEFGERCQRSFSVGENISGLCPNESSHCFNRSGTAELISCIALVQLFTISANANSSTFQFSPTSRRVQAWARPLGITTVCLGIIALLIGVIRYFTVQQALTKGKFPVTRFLIGSIALVLALLVIIVFGVLVAGKGPHRT
ncbi:hypothetical protein MPER_11485 [Moniliophthora perniciosa FA553]|nr:hypothetical protein MPER_11485 [Moniliophthora perniciosa FA553]